MAGRRLGGAEQERVVGGLSGGRAVDGGGHLGGAPYDVVRVVVGEVGGQVGLGHRLDGPV